MSKRIDLIGRRFGRLVVLSYVGSAKWHCICDCGEERAFSGSNLRRGTSRSCGCLARESVAVRNRRHGGKGTVEYIAWTAMVQRCTRESHPAFKNYGGRGIMVCPEWRHDFAAFLAHIGDRPSAEHSLDRIDNERGYEPGNVRWATYDVQMNNRRARGRDEMGRFRMNRPGEAEIQDAIRVALGNPLKYPDVLMYRNNCGMLVDQRGQRVRFGVANPGGADLIGIFTAERGGIFIAAEIKTAIGRQTDEQVRFEQLVIARGGEYVVLRSVVDAQRWVERLRRKYGAA